MDLKEVLEEVDKLKNQIDKLRPIDAETEKRIMQKFRLDWNYHSNNIEGNSLTFGETKSFLLHGITADGKPLKDHLDIKGHNEAILSLEDIIQNKRPLTESFIRELHTIILHEPYDRPAETPDGKPTVKRINIGRYKTSANHVKTVTGEIFYFASPEETAAKMNDLMDWYRQAIQENSLHPLIIAAELHYKFIRIHPFDDGNGRLARILMNLVLMTYGYPPVVIKTQEKQDYYQALRIADGGDTIRFDIYIGEQLIRSLELFLKGANGESVEDTDDVDKEIALLKAKLNGENEKIILSPSNGEKIIDNCLTPLLTSAFDKLQQLKELFDSSRLALRIITGLGLVRNYVPANKEDTIERLKLTFKETGISSFSLTFSLKDFIKTDKEFNVNVGLDISLSKFHYEVKIYPDYTYEQSVRYNEKNSKKKFEKIASELAKNVLLQINKKLED